MGFWEGLHAAVLSIPANLSQLSHSLGNPVLAQAPMQALNQSVYGVMYQRFDGQIGAMAYLLFVLLYVPCVSTIAAIGRELNRKWAIFSAVWSTGLAYGVAVSFYQLATCWRHPLSSGIWLFSLLIVFVLTVAGVRFIAMSMKEERYEFAGH